MMMGEVFCEFEPRELVVGGDAPHDSRLLKIRQVAVSGTARDVRDRVGDVRDAEWPARGGEELDHGLAARGVALIKSAQMYLDELVQFLVGGVHVRIVVVAVDGVTRGHGLLSWVFILSCNETQSQSTVFV